MALYPAQLTPEEKSLKKKYAKLLDKKKQLRKSNEKLTPQTAPKPNHKDIPNPKDAKEVAKRLLSVGKLSITKKSPVKRSGFKRVGQLPGQSPPRKKPNTAPETQATPPKPKVKAADQKALYSRFVKATIPSEDLERIPRRQHNSESLSSEQEQQKFSSKECTIFIRCHHSGIGEKALRAAFKRFGNIQTFTLDQVNNGAFITFNKPSIAVTAKKEMDRGMIHGSDVAVEPASSENGYVELPPEAASNPWSQIAAGRELTDSPVKKPGETHKNRQTITYSEPDF